MHVTRARARIYHSFGLACHRIANESQLCRVGAAAWDRCGRSGLRK